MCIRLTWHLNNHDITPVMNMKEALCFFLTTVIKCHSRSYVIFNAKMTKSCVGAPETAGGPLALKDVLILVSFLNLATGFENMNDHFFNAISLMWQPPSLRKNQSNHVTWMSYSLLTKARDTVSRAPSTSTIRQMCFLHYNFFLLFSTSSFCELAFSSQAYVSPNAPV